MSTKLFIEEAWEIARTIAAIDKQLLSSGAVEAIASFAAERVAAERERCAKVAEAYTDTRNVDGDRIYCNGWRHAAERIAARIRSGE